MSVEGMRCNARPCGGHHEVHNKKDHKSSTVSTAAKVAVAGAVVGGASMAAVQKLAISNDEFVSQVKTNAEDIAQLAKDNSDGIKGKALGFLDKSNKKTLALLEDVAKNEKMNFKSIGAHAGKVGLIFAGLYLGAKAIGGLFGSGKSE